MFVTVVCSSKSPLYFISTGFKGGAAVCFCFGLFLSGLLSGDAKWFVSVMVSNNLNVQGFVANHFQAVMMALDTQLCAMVGDDSDVMFMVYVQSFSGCDDGNRHAAVCHGG